MKKDEFSVQIQTIDQKLHYETKGKVYIEEFTQAMLTVILAVFNKALEPIPAHDLKRYKELLFDLMNTSFSGALRIFAPEIALRPDITEDAILRAENELIDEAFEYSKNRRKKKK